MEYIEMLKPLLTAENFKTASIVVQIYGVLLIIITMIMVKNAVLSPCSREYFPKIIINMILGMMCAIVPSFLTMNDYYIEHLKTSWIVLGVTVGIMVVVSIVKTFMMLIDCGGYSNSDAADCAAAAIITHHILSD